MSRLPENYEKLVPFDLLLQNQPRNEEIDKYISKIFQRFLDKGIEIPPAYNSMLGAMNSSEYSDTIYMEELLARLDRHLDPDVSEEDKTANIEQLHLLLNQKIAYIFDRDVMHAMLYGAGVAALASIALLSTAGVAALLMTNAPLSIMTLISSILSPLVNLGITIIPGTTLIAFSYSLAPKLFIETAGALAACATFVGVGVGIHRCATEISFAKNHYNLRSDVSALINTGLFLRPNSYEVDESGIEMTMLSNT
jgi:hypothetical protein